MKVLIVLLAVCVLTLGVCLFLNYTIPRVDERSSRENFMEGFVRALKEGDVNKIMSCYDESAEGIAFLLKDNPVKDKWRVRDAYIYEERYRLTREKIKNFHQTFGERYQGVKIQNPGFNYDDAEKSFIWYHYPGDRHKLLLELELKLARDEEGAWKITHSSIKERELYAYAPRTTQS